MDWSRKRRKSRDDHLDFSDLPWLKRHIHATTFIRLCEHYEPRMKQIVVELQVIAAKAEDVEEKSEEERIAGAVAAGVGVGIGAGAAAAIIATPFTGGLRLAIFGLAAASALTGSAALIGSTIQQRKTEREHLKTAAGLTEEFLRIVESLSRELEDVKSACGDAQGKPLEDEASDSLRELEQLIEMVKLNPFTTLDKVRQVAKDYDETLGEFGKLKTQLQALGTYGRRELTQPADVVSLSEEKPALMEA